MPIGADTVGLAFKITSDSSQARGDLSAFQAFIQSNLAAIRSAFEGLATNLRNLPKAAALPSTPAQSALPPRPSNEKPIRDEEAATLALARAQARLQVTHNDLVNAASALRTALSGVAATTAQSLSAQSQLARIETQTGQAALQAAQNVERLRAAQSSLTGAAQTLQAALSSVNEVTRQAAAAQTQFTQTRGGVVSLRADFGQLFSELDRARSVVQSRLNAIKAAFGDGRLVLRGDVSQLLNSLERARAVVQTQINAIRTALSGAPVVVRADFSQLFADLDRARATVQARLNAIKTAFGGNAVAFRADFAQLFTDLDRARDAVQSRLATIKRAFGVELMFPRVSFGSLLTDLDRAQAAVQVRLNAIKAAFEGLVLKFPPLPPLPALPGLPTSSTQPRTPQPSNEKPLRDEEAATLALARAQARLQVTQGDLAAAAQTLRAALAGVTSGTTAAITTQSQLARVEAQITRTALDAAQSTARLQAAQSELAAAAQTLQNALAGVNNTTRQSIQAQTQLVQLQNRLAGQQTELANGLRTAGTSLTAGITLPLAALSAASVKAAVDLDRQVNTLRAFTGSTQAAEKRLAELIATAQKTPGLTTNLAATLDAQLRVLSVTEQTINRILPAIGKLNAVSPLGDPQRFAQNLIQLVTQNFERQDLKELVGQSPLAGEIIRQLFNVDSPTNAEAIRQSAQKLGLTTTEAFFAAFANAAATNPKLANVTESIGAQFDKLRDRALVALRPLGLALVSAITPIVNAVVPAIEAIGRAFAALPKPAQGLVIALGAIAAAAGPLLFALGGLAQSALALGAAWTALQASIAAGGALAALPALFNPVTLGIGALVAVLGLAAFAWTEYEDAATRGAKATADAVAGQLKSLDQLKALQQQAREAGQAQAGSAEQHAKLAAIIRQLDPDTQAYLNTIKDEQVQVRELNRILAEQVQLRQSAIGQTLGDVGAAVEELEKKQAAATKTLAHYEAKIKELSESGKKLILVHSTLGEDLPSQVENYEGLGRAVNGAKQQLTAYDNALVGLGAKVNGVFEANRTLTIDGFIEQQKALGTSETAIAAAVRAYEAFKQQQLSSAVATSNTTGVINQQTTAIEALINSLRRLNQAANEKVDEGIKNIALSARNVAEAKARLQEALKLDDDFFFAVQERARVAKNLAALNEAIDPTPKKPSTAGATRALTASREESRAELRALELREKTIARLADAEIAAARRAFEAREISLRQLEEITLAAERRMLEAKRAVFEEERRLVNSSKLKEPQKVIERAEIQEREAAAIQAANEKILAIQAERSRREREANEREITERVRRSETAAQAEIERIKAQADARILSFEEAARQIAAAERGQLNRRRDSLNERFLFAGLNTEEQKKINDEIRAVNAEIEKGEEESRRRIAEGRDQDLAAQRRFVRETIELKRAIVSATIEAAQTEAENLQRRAEARPADTGLRRAAIDAQFAADQEAARLRHELNLARIADDEQAAIAAANNLAQIEEAERLSNERRLAEERRFKAERAGIRQSKADADAAADPASNLNRFGITDETLTGFERVVAAAKGAYGELASGALTMKGILVDVFKGVASATQSTLQSFILTGKGGAAAFKQLAAGIISALAVEALVKVPFQIAEGLANKAKFLATGAANFAAAAAANFAAAKFYATIGGGALALGLGIGAAGGLGGGDAGGTAQGASAFGGRDRDEPEERRFRFGDVTGRLNDPDRAGGENFVEVVTRLMREGQETQQRLLEETRALTAANLTAAESTYEATHALASRLTSFSAGEVLAIGVHENPTAVADGAKEGLIRDAGFVRTLAEHLRLN